MLTGIDHIVIAVGDPETAAASLEASVGLRAAGGGRHPALGTANRLVWLGDAYLELIGVTDDALAAGSWIGRPTLAALDRGGGLATFALASDDLAADVARLRDFGGHWDGPTPGARVRDDGRTVAWSLAAPGHLGPEEPPFLIEHDLTAAEWTAAERAARAGDVHPLGSPVRLEGLTIPVSSVRRTQGAYLRSLGLLVRPSLAGRGARETSVGPHAIRLMAASMAGVGSSDTATVRLVATGIEPRVVDVLGIRFHLRG